MTDVKFTKRELKLLGHLIDKGLSGAFNLDHIVKWLGLKRQYPGTYQKVAAGIIRGIQWKLSVQGGRLIRTSPIGRGHKGAYAYSIPRDVALALDVV